MANASTTAFQLLTLEQVETFVDITTDQKCFTLLERETFVANIRLRYFIMLCKDAEYKNMDQGESLGQSYNVQN